MANKKLHLVGCAYGIAGVDEHSGDGPLMMRKSPYMAKLDQNGVDFDWLDMVINESAEGKRIDEAVAESCTELANIVSPMIKENKSVCVVGGDHSCAIGTWSGVYAAMHEQGDLGLIWIDAHMDSHTPETSESGRIHGMPLAVLMGYGFPTLTSVITYEPKLKPENVCLIGVRSFEKGEEELLKKLNVRVYFMDEVKERGFETVLKEAVDLVSKNTVKYGVSIDIDAVDPKDAPGVDVPEDDGIRGDALCNGLKDIINDPRLILTEVVEFDPGRDIEHKTEKLIADIICIIASATKE